MPNLTHLRRILADLYPRMIEQRRVAADAGLREGAIAFDPSADTSWFNILQYADKQGRVEALIALARTEYPNNEQLSGLHPAAPAPTPAAAPEHADVAILTAIEVERKAVCAAFGLGDGHRVKRGGRWYWRGALPLPGDASYTIVVAQPADMGQIEATALTKDVLRDFHPRAALLVGIAATTDPKKVRLGDVVVGKSVWYYEQGKVTEHGTRPQPDMMPADAGLLQSFTGLPDWDGRVLVERPGGGDDRPRVHQGVIASGEKVIADAATRDEIASGNRKIMAIAMEDYGFSRAIWQSAERVQHLVLRGICDDGKPAKDDRWHAYAAAAAAGLARHFLSDRPLG
jgi:nucleoside phosphorylase